MERYNFKLIEEKWQSYWEKNKSFSVKTNPKKKKFYCLEMFPYPSGKIHMGHVRNYTIGDVLSRYKIQKGFNVLHPMGWDSFGMPAENAARLNKLDPKIWTEKNISIMKFQLKKLGLSIDWDREISTCSPEYYEHQQKFFLDLYDKGLVYRKENYVNWDPVDKTVLANEQVINGKGWRSGATVERKKLNQWFFNINKFSEELLSDLEKLDQWPTKVKVMQKNWIGKSFGCELNFEILGNSQIKEIKCFTTRPDTLFGMSFLAVSIDHPLANIYKDNIEFEEFKVKCSKTGTTEESIAQAEKYGFKTTLLLDKKADEVMWLFTIISQHKDLLQKKLREKNIETNQVHFRNDRYSIFKKFVKNKSFKNMDLLQNKYLVLPMHTKMTSMDAKKISLEINRILNNIDK